MKFYLVAANVLFFGELRNFKAVFFYTLQFHFHLVASYHKIQNPLNPPNHL